MDVLAGQTGKGFHKIPGRCPNGGEIKRTIAVGILPIAEIVEC